MKYHTYEVHTQSPDGIVCIRTIRATSAEQAERMVAETLREGWRIIGTVYQFKLEDGKK